MCEGILIYVIVEDVGAIVLDVRVTKVMRTGSLGQFVGILSSLDFRPVNMGSTCQNISQGS